MSIHQRIYLCFVFCLWNRIKIIQTRTKIHMHFMNDKNVKFIINTYHFNMHRTTSVYGFKEMWRIQDGQQWETRYTLMSQLYFINSASLPQMSLDLSHHSKPGFQADSLMFTPEYHRNSITQTKRWCWKLSLLAFKDLLSDQIDGRW